MCSKCPTRKRQLDKQDSLAYLFLRWEGRPARSLTRSGAKWNLLIRYKPREHGQISHAEGSVNLGSKAFYFTPFSTGKGARSSVVDSLEHYVVWHTTLLSQGWDYFKVITGEGEGPFPSSETGTAAAWTNITPPRSWALSCCQVWCKKQVKCKMRRPSRDYFI